MKGAVLEPGPVGEHGAAGAKQFVFVHEIDPRAPARGRDMGREPARRANGC